MSEQYGFSEAPSHYAPSEPGDRETIDMIRDRLGDRAFADWCRGQVLRYRDREGRKTEGDGPKAAFYEQMLNHVLSGGRDPRESRGPAYVPYVRQDDPDQAVGDTKCVLDHGYLRFVESWGRGVVGVPEAGIIEAARQSTAGAFRGWDKDERLLRYLYTHKHSTPFEFAGMTIEVQAPIFVFRQWHRHRTQSYNEMSARYVQMPSLDYCPTPERLRPEETENKQAGTLRDAPELSDRGANSFRVELAGHTGLAESSYEHALKIGVPKELARLFVPLTRYSRMRATANLRNWLHFMTLRCDPHAQWEIRQYANALARLVAREFPRTYALWCDEVGHGD